MAQTQISKAKSKTGSTRQIADQASWVIRYGELLAPVSLVSAGVMILVSNYLALFGFEGFIAIGVGIISIASGGILVEHWQRYAWLTVLLTTACTALCIMGLISQIQASEFLAATISSSVIALQMGGAILTLYCLSTINR